MKVSHYLRAAAAAALDADAGGNDVRTINHLTTQAREIVHHAGIRISLFGKFADGRLCKPSRGLMLNCLNKCSSVEF